MSCRDPAQQSPAPIARIVVVNYNGKGFVERSVRSALSQTASVEIVVVDNGSSDGSPAELSKLGVCLIRSAENLGFGGAANLGSRGAATEFLAFLNPDAVADPQWIAELSGWMDAQGVDVASSVVRESDGFYFGRGLWVWWLGGSTHVKDPSPDSRTDWVNGCALVIRRSLFEKLNGFDDGFFLYGEDVDLSLRARAEGARLGMYASPLARHDSHGRSTDQLGDRKFEIAFESRGRLTRKHCPIVALPMALLVQGLYHPLRLRPGGRGAAKLASAYFRGFWRSNAQAKRAEL